MKREKVEEVLTPELFKNIVNNMSDEMVNLKSDKNIHEEEIISQKENLKQLKTEKKALIKSIRVGKRALRKEKRVLYKTKKGLKIKKNLINEINNKFASSEEVIINVKRYIK